ncbi:fractalkine-like isoform X2 [Heterodontus francisci]|uniref:fractalkine-like isoform X2 n=1 Tax=Heterodontus francisci TaxID=7792 RepID=UPI00355B6067
MVDRIWGGGLDVLAAKSETESDSCCSGYTKQVVKRGFFNRFERSYWMAKVCGTQKMAVVLKLKKEKAMCADPEMEWVKLLMKRIDTEKKRQSVSAKVKTPEKQSSINNTPGTDTRIGSRPTSTVPTSRPVTITHKQARTDPTHSAQGSSKSPAHPQRGEGAGIPTTEGQTRPNPATAEGDTTGVRSPWARGAPTSSPTTSVRRETTGSPPESTEQQGRGGSEQRPSETRASSLSLGKAQSDGATTVSPLPWLNVAQGTVVASGQEGGGRPGQKLLNSKVAVLILLPVTLLLFSGIVYLYCKKKGRAGPTYHVAPSESAEGIYDAL